MTTHGAAEVAPIDEAVDHVSGASAPHMILEYGDYECPYSRAAYRQILRVQRELDGGVGFAFRHFPLTAIHPHALAASAAAEAAAIQGRFWPMHDKLFRHQGALVDQDLQRYAAELDLDVVRFNSDRESPRVMQRIGRDVQSGLATGQVIGTPTLFVDGVVHLDGYAATELVEALGQ